MTDAAQQVFVIWSDGSCLGNPGPGGFAAVVLDAATGRDVAVVVGSDARSTNQRMEMTAAAKGLAAVPEGSSVLVRTDSKYVVDGMTKWTFGWRRAGWKKKDGGEIANLELWQELVALCSVRNVKWQHVRGHAGIDLNERVDRLANAEARKIKTIKTN